MNGHDPAAEIAILHLAEPGVTKHRGQLVLIGKRANGFRQVAVHVRMVLGHPCADGRQESKRIPVIDAPEPGRNRPGKLQTHEAATRFQHAMNLAKGLRPVAHVADTEPRGHRVERAVQKRDPLRVPAKTGDAGSQAAACNLRHAHAQHGEIQIHGRHSAVRPHATIQQQGQIPGSRAQVQGAPARPNGNQARGQRLPAMMKSETEQGIIQIVPGRNRGKHALHGPFARRTGPLRHGLAW